ncbi:glycerol-3-phosphate ABC transporter [Gracilibacillus boraciitolerans JCM 21714]|uniref:Glycerol-3-phosphate ABC transporter n=1 Tax=Gracilibacillus boraciitolerans JCM 21714 TaxID=1298598 RepID=W4VMT1_9BACI|nr:ABC transporter substrate-binding protein [Gracilibacillus boraciitolerans]GAE94059.1 glycerol-3-phosphate ABC transporter [Gracilibacillus boraciitolerans JCM 21714]
MKKLLLLLVAISMIMFITACSNEADGQESDENTNTTEETTENTETEEETPEKATNDKVEAVFWHAMSGEGQESIEAIVDNFNQSQDEYTIIPEFQGSYEEALTKYRSVGGTADAPAIIQTFEVGTKYMIDSGFIEPVQSFIDEEGYDVSQLEENILNYYTVDDQLYSMPFNSSTPVMLYNKDAFKEAGLDPENPPPQTFEEIKEAAEKLTVKNGDNTERYGFSILNYGWFIEELIATQGGLYVNNDNGRSDSATEAVFNGEEGLRIFELMDEMNKAGTYGNFGSNWDDIRAAFQTENTAMYLDSSAGVTTTVENAPFEVGVAYIPYSEEAERNGVIIGGASLWMSNGIEEEKQKAAWEFMKYLQSPESQAKWHIETGYFAINPAAYEEDIVKDKWKEYPQLKVTVDQLQETKPSFATQGALISVFPEARQQVVTAMENVLQGTDPKEALDKAAEETNRVIEQANRANQ